MNKAKINKYIEYATTKVKIMYKEKKFRKHGYRLKYMLDKHDSDQLIIIFSGVPRVGMKARYNYGRTLSTFKANKLFILDDFGYDQRGAFYLGKDKDFKIKDATSDLIEKVKYELNIKHTIYCGSSKGGYNALMFGLEDEGSTIIAGGPQYYLGQRLTKGEFAKHTLPYIMGKDYTEDDIKILDSLLPDIVSNANNKNCDIYLHYSNQEYMYHNHIKYLVDDLSKFNIDYHEDVADYKEHAEIAYHFPGFLVNTLKKVVK